MEDVRLTLRLSREERDAWQAAAGELAPLGRWVRQVVNRSLESTARPTAAAEIARAATSLAEEKGRSVNPDWRKK